MGWGDFWTFVYILLVCEFTLYPWKLIFFSSVTAYLICRNNIEIGFFVVQHMKNSQVSYEI